MALRLPLLPRPVRWLPAVLVAGVICYGSVIASPPALPLAVTPITEPTAVTASGVGLILETPLRPSDRRHAIAYATLTLSLAYAIADRDLPVARKALLVFAVAMAYGVVMEFGQLFRPERTASIADVTVNGVGALIALQWYALERRVRFVPVGAFARPVDARRETERSADRYDQGTDD